MTRFFALALFVLLGISPAFAASEAFTVTSCGTALTNPYTAGQFNAIVIDVNGNTCTSNGGNGFPAGSTPVTGVFSGADTTTAAATLPAGAAGVTTYICGFTVSGLGSTAGGPVTVTVATLAPGSTLSYSYVFTASAATPNTPLAINYNPCLPASAAAAAITITVPGQAGNTATQINASGFQK